MEGQTNCVLCDYKSRSVGSLKQHMESKHNVYNMTIVQVLTQQVERVNYLESQVKEKELLMKKIEVDLTVTKEALQKEKECLEEKEKAMDDLITSQKQKALEESKLVEELKLSKVLVTKAQQDLETKTSALNSELEKVKVITASTQTVSDCKEVLNVKQEESKTSNEEKQKEIPCKYFHRIKGCRRGNKCWFFHDEKYEKEKLSTKVKQNLTKKFKDEQNVFKESKQGQDSKMKQLNIVIELLTLLLTESII